MQTSTQLGTEQRYRHEQNLAGRRSASVLVTRGADRNGLPDATDVVSREWSRRGETIDQGHEPVVAHVSPPSVTSDASSARRDTSSLANAVLRYFFTVFSEISSSVAISILSNPLATR